MPAAAPRCRALATVILPCSRRCAASSTGWSTPIRAFSRPMPRRRWATSSLPTLRARCRTCTSFPAARKASKRRSSWRDSISSNAASRTGGTSSPGGRAITATRWVRWPSAATRGGGGCLRRFSRPAITSHRAMHTAARGATRRWKPTADAWPTSLKPRSSSWAPKTFPYLWRFWRNVPRYGGITIFDRSWYGRVLVERVEGYCSVYDWMRAYDEINQFEEQLTQGTMLTLQTALGFTLTLVTIHLLPL